MTEPRCRARWIAAVALVVVMGCTVESPAPEGDEAVAAAQELVSDQRLVDRLAYGQTSAPVTTSGVLRFRAFVFEGEAGDRVTVDVRSTDGGDARTWLLGPDLAILAADASHVEATLTDGGTHVIVLRDATRRRRTFTVELQGGPPAAPSLAIGFNWHDSRLVTFDPVAGTVEQVHMQMGEEAFIGMTYDPTHDILYAVSQVDFNLYAIDPATMTSSHIGDLRIDRRSSWGQDIAGIAYDPDRDVLYGTVVRWDIDRTRRWTELVRVDVTTAALATIGTLSELPVGSIDFNTDDGKLYGLSKGVDGAYSVVRVDPDGATGEVVLATEYGVMIGLARKPGTNQYLTWINADHHFYGEIDLDTGTITPLADADAIRAIAAFVYRTFDAGAVAVPRPEVPASFRFTGHVTSVEDPDERLGGSIRPGAGVAGRIAYDVNAPYRPYDWAATGSYGISATIGGWEFAIDTLAAQVENNHFDGWTGTLTDSIEIVASRDRTSTPPVPPNLEEIRWAQVDASARALTNNDTLPTRHDLSAWDRSVLRFQVSGGDLFESSIVTVALDDVTP